MAAGKQASAASSRRVIAVTQHEQPYAGQEPITGRRRRPGEIFTFPGSGALPLVRRSRGTGLIERGWVQRVDANDQPIEEDPLDQPEESGIMDRTPSAERRPGRNRIALSPAQRAMQVPDANEPRLAKLDPERVAR